MTRLNALCALGLLSIMLIAASSGAAPSKDETNLSRETSRLDKTAAAPAGEAAVIKRIAGDFGIGPDRVAALREKGLGYGEMTVALSLASRMAGGASDENMTTVMALRRGPPERGWGEVAKQLKIKLGIAVSQVKKVNNEAHREIKAEHGAPQSRPNTAGTDTRRHEPRTSFSGEGKDMTRGSAAK